MRTHRNRSSVVFVPAMVLLLGLTAGAIAQVAPAQPPAPATRPESTPAEKPAATTVPSVAWTPIWEHWNTLEISGATAGWMHDTAFSDGERYRSKADMSFRISRGPIEIEIKMSTEFIETHDGRPLEIHFVQDMSLQSVDTRWIFGETEVVAISKQGGREVRNELPLPTVDWLTPMAVHRFMMERIKAGAETITYKTVDGQSGIEPTVMKHERKGAGEVEALGRKLPVTIWNTTTSAMPGVSSTTTLSADGFLVREEVDLPFGRMVTRAATKAEAMAAGAGPAPELMVTMFVPAKTPIERARSTKRATLLLRIQEGELPEIPSAGAQRAEMDDARKTATLHLDADRSLAASAADRENPEYLKSSAMADLGDPMIQKLATRATRGAGESPMEKAESLRRFVHEHISSKALDTAFATASETARTKNGDCSEHGVLLCAMLRAQGIPARVASGLIYADYFAGQRDIFGWHMWTQALIDGNWVDFDATIEDRFDAVHVLTGTSSLGDGVGSSDLNSMMLLIGNIEIDVVDVQYD